MPLSLDELFGPQQHHAPSGVISLDDLFGPPSPVPRPAGLQSANTPAPGSWDSFGMPSMQEMERADQQAAAEAGLSVYDLNLQRAAQAEQADRTFLTDNPVYRVGEGAVQSAADAIVNPLLAAESALGFETAGDMLQARQAEQDKRQLIDRTYPEEIASGIADSLAGTATRAVVGGLPAVFAGMGHQSYIDAHRQAKKEGKTDDEAAKIARANTAFEVGVMGAFQAAGLGGLESAIAKSAGWQGVKKFAVQTLGELAEEELTTLGQQLASQGNIDNPQAFLDTAVQTIGTMGLVGGSQKIARFVKNPTKKTAEAAGIPPEVARTQRDRVRLAEEAKRAQLRTKSPDESEDGQETRQPPSKKLDTEQPPAPTSPVDASVPETTQEPPQPVTTQPEPSGEAEGGVQTDSSAENVLEPIQTPPPKRRIGARKHPAENVFPGIQNPAPQLEEYSSSTDLSTPAKEPWQMTRKELLEGNVNPPNNSLTPWEGEIPPVGSWRIDPDTGELEQLREFDPNELHLTESAKDVERTEVMEKYVEWAKAGRSAPPVTVVTNADTGQPISTNRRRVLAARKAGTKILGWQSDATKGQTRGTTHKAFVQQALIDGKPVPPEVLADYPDLSTPSVAPPDAPPAEVTPPLGDSGVAAPTALSRVTHDAIPEGIEVDVTSIDVRTGERSTVKQTAREAIQEQDQSLDLMKRLLACLRA